MVAADGNKDNSFLGELLAKGIMDIEQLSREKSTGKYRVDVRTEKGIQSFGYEGFPLNDLKRKTVAVYRTGRMIHIEDVSARGTHLFGKFYLGYEFKV